MNTKPKSAFKVDYYVFHVLDRGKDKKAIWTRLGVATRSRTGKETIHIKLNATPLNGRLTLLVPEEHEEVETAEAEA